MWFMAERGTERFEIAEGNGQGFYVFRYVDGECTHDYLQDDIRLAYDCAEENWGLDRSVWRPASPGETPLFERAR
jgi:hypothetical protein